MQNLAYEIILTLGQAFEVAYQLALQARKGGHSSTLPESFENKPSKPIPKPRVSIRKSVVSRQDTGVLRTEGKDLWCVGAAKNPGPALPVQSPSVDQEPDGHAVPGPRSVLYDDLQVSSSSEESDWEQDTSGN